MTSKPLPPHGSSARAWGSPGYRPKCTCEPCLATRRKVQKRARVARELGQGPFTSPHRAQAHIADLLTVMKWEEISAASGVTHSNIAFILRGQRRKIKRTTEQAILSVPFPHRPDANKAVDATSTRRRIEALMLVGHGQRELSRKTGLATQTLWAILYGHRTAVRQRVETLVADAYSDLITRPAPQSRHTSRIRNVAIAKGWAPLAAYDDISDPQEVPKVDPHEEAGRRELAAYRLEEIRHLASFGVADREIAARLDMDDAYVRALIRNLRAAA